MYLCSRIYVIDAYILWYTEISRVCGIIFLLGIGLYFGPRKCFLGRMGVCMELVGLVQLYIVLGTLYVLSADVVTLLPCEHSSSVS